MKPAFLFFLPLLWSALPAIAAPIELTLTNKSGEQLTAVSATPRDAPGDQTQSVMAQPIDTGGYGSATIEAAEGICLFDLTFTFVSGKTVSRTDTDICQTDGIIVE